MLTLALLGTKCMPGCAGHFTCLMSNLSNYPVEVTCRGGGRVGTLPSLSDFQTSVLASSPLGSLPGASNCPSPSLVPPPSPTAHNIPTPAVCPAQLFHHIPLHGLTEAQALGCGDMFNQEFHHRLHKPPRNLLANISPCLIGGNSECWDRLGG